MCVYYWLFKCVFVCLCELRCTCGRAVVTVAGKARRRKAELPGGGTPSAQASEVREPNIEDNARTGDDGEYAWDFSAVIVYVCMYEWLRWDE